MREIKVRFWHKILRRMSKPHGLGVIWEYLCEEWGGPFDWTDVEKLQYIGLHDKNGVEIYDGNIVRIVQYPGVVGAVAWNHDRWGIQDYSPCANTVDGDYCDDSIDWERGEVIGNIYEHPELLEGA